ncbi:E3 ubiquitin-protein ligase MIB2-like isoform X1 [Microplitis mediator]|uniref:E3 ubiquitin-protein ligase MIB2-like isoform X1 n=1 Tax=Microplitis mediator TaxID=375433 RepID=UPI0025549BBE|nr:E3 ubiquitin-protein ligase MIB2-like isoform X1 [Microplitis mediator]XP_057330331.1 E3 ubiquitin-protein ligase MIB2-like isoform X1 [Microplitis mediator]
MLEVGLRVVRGYDWKWKDQDNGEGHAGTIVEIGKPPLPPGNATTSSSNPTDKTPDKTVIVQWDHGSRSNYRIGYQGYYDLLVFDNAAAGVQHNNIICDGCKRHGIVGIRWKCAQCHDYDLCTQCYMGDTHDLTHIFQRFQTANAVGVQLTPRTGCTKIPLKGIFIGAKVVRGPDWEWGNQDGGPGKTGRVIDIRGWDNESSRSVATVTWASGSTNVYRLGYKGCVDLCYVEYGTCGTYYKEHLPVLGQSIMTMTEENNGTGQSDNLGQLTFNVGDKVKVLRDVDSLKDMQAGHGGWNPRMAEYIGKVGTVHRITDKGDVRVQYEGCNNRWTFHPRALTKVTSQDTFVLGDIVRVKNDAAAIKSYQQGHGEWIDVMKSALGKLGKVIKIYPDGDLRVTLEGHTWTFNPLSVVKIASGQGVAGHPDGHRIQQESVSNDVTIEVEKLLRDAARGEAGLTAVREFLKKYSGNVDICSGKKTFLQVAAHQGNRDLCVLLLDAGASLKAIDEDGDPPLHYAAFGNQPGVMELLLSRGAPIDAINNSGCTALHVSVNKENSACVQVLLRHGCNVNLQDSYGDTALHDAISKETDIMYALINYDSVDFTIRNKRGFNVLHHAALKGNAHATKKLMSRVQHLIDVKKDDGFAALHLAALNGHREVAAILLSGTNGRATVDLRNNRKQTPLHLAVSQGHWSLVELLLRHNADILATDEDGDTVLHIAIAKSRHHAATSPTSDSRRDAPMINAIWEDLVNANAPSELALACFLVSVENHGAFLMQVKNSKGKVPVDLMPLERSDINFTDLLRSYFYFRRRNGPETDSASVSVDQPSYTNTPIAEGRNEESTNGPSVSTDRVLNKKDDSVKNEDSLQSEETPKKAEIKEREKDKDLERLRFLETRVADLEEVNMCSICMERRRNVAFLCGHGACENCAAPLKTCHMCRKTITKKINLY